MLKLKSALISVFNKDGLEPIAKKLNTLGVKIYSTGGTELFLKKICYFPSNSTADCNTHASHSDSTIHMVR